MNHRIFDKPMIADCDGKWIYHWTVPDSVAAYQDSDGGDGRHCPYPPSTAILVGWDGAAQTFVANASEA